MSELVFDQVSVRYGIGRAAVTAVDAVSMTVPDGGVTGVVGESGSGKSTLARAAVGLLPLDGGRILLDGAPIPRRGPRPLQMVFQDPFSSLDPRMPVGASIAEMMPGRMTARAREAEVSRLLTLVHLDPAQAGSRPARFSGGQRQRIAIARALASDPTVIVADEPVSALDASTRLQVAGLLSDTAVSRGAALLMISHDLSGLRVIADRIAVMYFGRIVEVGPTEAIWTDPRHPYTRTLIQAIPRLGRDAPMPSEPGRREPVVVSDEDARLVECAPGHYVAAEALVAS